MAGGRREVFCLCVPRPKHPEVKRQWRKWCGEARIDAENHRVFIVDVMHPHHAMAKLYEGRHAVMEASRSAEY